MILVQIIFLNVKQLLVTIVVIKNNKNLRKPKKEKKLTKLQKERRIQLRYSPDSEYSPDTDWEDNYSPDFN
jgi:hypothetical protein